MQYRRKTQLFVPKKKKKKTQLLDNFFSPLFFLLAASNIFNHLERHNNIWLSVFDYECIP